MAKLKYGGGPTLSSDDFCMECLKDGAKNAVSADVYRERKASLKNLAEAALSGNCPDGPSYFISKTWYAKCILLLISDLCSMCKIIFLVHLGLPSYTACLYVNCASYSQLILFCGNVL